MIHTYVLKTRCYGLEGHANVFQAELYAIKQAVDLIAQTKATHRNDDEFNNIRILSDSQAALMSIDKIDTDSKLVQDVKEALNKLGSEMTVELAWIKAHVNHKGNELADRLAKTGTKMVNKATMEPGRAMINAQITKHIYDRWNERWVNNSGHRQTKVFLPNVYNRGTAKNARLLSRQDTGILVRNITGHAFLGRHNDIVEIGYYAKPNDALDQSDYEEHLGTEPDPLAEVDLDTPNYAVACRLCKTHRSIETPFHLLSECNATWRERRDHLQTYNNINAHYTSWKPTQLVGFYKALSLEN